MNCQIIEIKVQVPNLDIFYLKVNCSPEFQISAIEFYCICMGDKSAIVDTARSSGILKAKQKLGRTFNSDKLGGIAFTKISKLTMCSAYEDAQAIVPGSTS